MTSPRVLVIGAGMSGLAMGVKLKAAGFDDFTILEKGSDVGGVWFWNRYPGLACDVPSLLYRYSFQNKTDWPNIFSSRDDILAYHRGVADDHDLWPHIRLDSEVVSARFADNAWHVETAAGDELTADFLVAATGVLHHPNRPDIPGLDDFAGPVVHTARWDRGLDTTDKRIAIVGGGSTGVQITGALQATARTLTLFQRTPQWVLWAPTTLSQPKFVTAVFRRKPALAQASFRAWVRASALFTDLTIHPGIKRRAVQSYARLCLHLIRDRDLRERLRPDYQPLCKRQVLSGNYFRAIQQANVEVVTDRVDHVDATGIVTADGNHHDLDIVVLATGFEAHNYMRPMDLTGRDGITIDEAWKSGPHAFAMTSIPGFPNFFTILGPNSPVGSIHLQTAAELTCDHIIRWISAFANGELTSVEVSENATRRFNSDVVEALQPTVWNTGCESWYFKDDGTVDLWPFDLATLKQFLGQPLSSDYLITYPEGGVLDDQVG
ncbi:MAG: monooxygenase [Gordonia sp.]|nr:monooxygenase [Gordonia sp. (in: high G+C Gram-positive bacteria)]